PAVQRPRRPHPLPYPTLFRSSGTDQVAGPSGAGFQRRVSRCEFRLADEAVTVGVQIGKAIDEALVSAGLGTTDPMIAIAVHALEDRKSTRLNSSHVKTSYAVC